MERLTFTRSCFPPLAVRKLPPTLILDCSSQSQPCVWSQDSFSIVSDLSLGFVGFHLCRLMSGLGPVRVTRRKQDTKTNVAHQRRHKMYIYKYTKCDIFLWCVLAREPLLAQASSFQTCHSAVTFCFCGNHQTDTTVD